MVDQHYRREKLSNEKINAFINRARSTFQRFRKSQPYRTGQNMVGDFGDLDLYLEDEQVEAIEHCLQEIGCDHYSGPHHPNDVACDLFAKVKGYFSSFGNPLISARGCALNSP